MYNNCYYHAFQKNSNSSYLFHELLNTQCKQIVLRTSITENFLSVHLSPSK